MAPSKILFLGAEGVGKTALLRKFATNEFDDDDGSFADQHTIQVDAGGKKVPVELHHNCTKEQLSDEGVVGVVFVFDVTSQESFDQLAPMVSKMREVLPNAPAVMCANKVEDDNADQRVVTFLGAKEVYSATIPVFETSAKTGKNIKTVISNLGMLVGADLAASSPSDDNSMEANSAPKKGCCIVC
jgi:small GTP-binding protein